MTRAASLPDARDEAPALPDASFRAIAEIRRQECIELVRWSFQMKMEMALAKIVKERILVVTTRPDHAVGTAPDDQK